MKNKFIHFFVYAAVAGVLLWLYLPPLSHYHNLKSEEQRLKKQVELMDEKVAKLQEERDLLKNDVDYLEKVVREELGLVKPGEVVYKFVETETPVEKIPASGLPANDQ